MNNLLGISSVCFEKNNDNVNKQLLEEFSFFDIPLKQALYFKKDIFSVQSLIDFNLYPNASLVNSSESFNILYDYFCVLSINLSKLNIKSVILGSPFIRKKTIISVEELSSRIKRIRKVFSDQNIKLYIEALPKEFSDVINSHQDLIDLNVSVPYGIHVDIATAISCKEEFSFFKDNINIVERFHFSVPGYGYNFEDYLLSVELLNLFLSKKIKGTIEIQNYENFEINSFLNKIHGFTSTKHISKKN
tara:strand:+ start:246 stop:986 length:741 start_codon:yes stop_codon:yes gene_type:complete